MKLIGNIVWLICGGLEAAIGYFTASIALFVTIIGIPAALQTFKLGFMSLWPFGAEVHSSDSSVGCLSFFLNIIWLICGGLFAFAMHIIFGLLLCITIIGFPWGLQHFKMAMLALAPFGKEVTLSI